MFTVRDPLCALLLLLAYLRLESLGISPATGRPFSPPVAFRTKSRTEVRKLEKTKVLEGKCHKCRGWAPVEGVKLGDVKVTSQQIVSWNLAETK